MGNYHHGAGAVCDMPAAPESPMVRQLMAENAKLLRENENLAEEVLRCYEQINLVFDVSAQIAVLTDAEEVRRLLLVKLRHMFGAEAAYFLSANRSLLKQVDANGQVRRVWAAEPFSSGAVDPAARQTSLRFHGVELPAEFDSATERLARNQRVFVHVGDAHWATGHGTSMWGPLQDDDGGFATIGLVRRCKPFIAGDMLLLDSTLTYASHILNNLRLIEQLKKTGFEAVRALVNAIDQKDPYTAGHSERVGFLAKITGQHIGLPAAQIQQLEWAGLLHDIGKIGIPENILNKPGALTAEEFNLIKEHPSRSFEVLRPVAQLETLLDAVLYHHENPDGSGYPKGLKGEEIPLMASIIHVVDVFDALTSTRSYRDAFAVDKAIDILKKDAGAKLDARIVQEFIDAWRLLPRTHPEQYERWFANVKET